MNDKDFRAEAEKAKLEITPVSGDTVEALVPEIYRTPETIAQRAAAALTIEPPQRIARRTTPSRDATCSMAAIDASP